MSLFNILKISQKNVYDRKLFDDNLFFGSYKLICVIYQRFVEFFSENVIYENLHFIPLQSYRASLPLLSLTPTA